MIGAHELLLIVRAQNQASAAIGRVARDLRTLEARRTLAMRQSQSGLQRMRLNEQMTKNSLRLQSLATDQITLQSGKVKVLNAATAEGRRIQEAAYQAEARTLNLRDRLRATSISLANIDRQRTNASVRRIRLEQQQLAIFQAEAVEAARILKMQSTLPFQRRRLGVATGAQQLELKSHQLITTQMQREVALKIQQNKLQAIQNAEMDDAVAKGEAVALQKKRVAIAQRKLEEIPIMGKGLAIQRRQLGVLSKEISRDMKANALAVETAKDAYVRFDAQLRATEIEIAKLADELKILDMRETQAIARANEIRLAQSNLVREQGALLASIKAQGAAMADAAAESVRLAKADQYLAMQERELALAMKTQDAQAWAQRSRAISHAGRVMQLFGLVSAAAMGYAAKGAADFNTELTRAATQARPAGAPIQATMRLTSGLMDVVLKQMKEFPASSSEMAESLYEIFSGTKINKIGDAAKMLRTFNMMAVAGQTDLKTMTDAGISLFNNFGNEFPRMEDAANAFFAAVRFGRMDASQFATSLSNILPIAKEAGLNFRDVADAMATLTRQSGAKFTSRDATGLARLIQVLGRPEMIAGLRKMGVQVEDLRTGKMRPLLNIIGEIAEKFKLKGIKPGPEVLNFFKTVSAMGGGAGSRGFQGTIQAQRTFSFLVNNMETYSRVSKQVNQDQDEFIKSYKALQQTPGVQWKVFVNQIKALVTVLGQGAIPAFISLGSWIQKVVQRFNEMSPHTRRTIGYLLAIVGAGTLLVGILGSLVGGIMSFYFSMQLLRTAKAIGVMGGLAAEGGFLTAQMMLLVAAAGAVLVIFYKWPGVFHTIVNELGGLKAALETVLLILVARKFGIFSSIIAEAIAATGAVTTLGVALATLGAIGAVVVTIVIIRKLLDENGSPLHGLAPETHDLIKDFKKSIRHPLDFHANVRVWGDLGRVLWTHDPNKQIEQDLRESIDRLGPIKAESGKKAQLDMRRQFDIKLAQSSHIVRQAQAAATLEGVKATKTFVQYYRALVMARRELEKHPHSIRANFRYQMALSNLQQNVTKQQNAAGKSLLKGQQLFSDREIKAQYKHVKELEKIAKNTKTYEAWKAYYKALDKLQSSATSAQMQALDATTENAVKNSTKINDTAKQTFETALSNIQNMYQNFLSQEQSAFGQLFQGPFIQSPMMQERMDWGAQLKTGDLLKDLRSQVKAFENWQKQLTRLGRKVPASLVTQIQAMGPEAAQKQLTLLNQMSPRELRKYVALWQRSQKEINKAAMVDTKRQIAQYKKFGRQVALAIIAGIKSENPALERQFRIMLEKMFPILAEKAHRSTKPSQPHKRTLAKEPKVTHETHHHTTYKITAPESSHPSVKAQLASAHWHHRTRNRK